MRAICAHTKNICHQRFCATVFERLATKIAEDPARSGDDQTSRSKIARLQFQSSVTLDTTACDIAQVQGCGAVTTDALAARQKVVKQLR